MNDIHDPAGCRQPACQRCDDYGLGYSAGKDKAAFEFQHHDYMSHADGCQCAPCLLWTQATAGLVTLLLQVRNEGVDSVDGLKEKLCLDVCFHDRCGVVFALELLYQQTKAEVDDHNDRALHDRRN